MATASATAPGADSGGIERTDASGSILGIFSTLVSTPVPGSGSPAPGGTGAADGSASAPSPSPAVSSKRIPAAEIWWRDLLKRLKQPDAAQLRVFLQSRLRQFSIQSVDDMPATGPGSITDQVQKIQRETLARMQKCGPWSDLSEDGWVQTTEAVERFVASQLHNHVIGAVTADKDADEHLLERCDALSTFVTADQLGVPASAMDRRFADAWSSAQDFLHRISAFKDPWRKLLCIDRCCRQLYRVLHAAAARQRATHATSSSSGSGSDAHEEDEATTSGAGEGESHSSSSESGARASADDLVPCVIWCLLRSNPGRLHSHLSFIERFRPAGRIRGSLGYHMTVVRSAVTFVEQVDAKHLGMDAEDFKARMEEGSRHAEGRKGLAQRLQRIGDGDVESNPASGEGEGGLLELDLLPAAPTAAELPLVPPLPKATDEALEEWKALRFRFLDKDPSALTLAEVPQLLEEYRNIIATCASVAEALGLPPPDVAKLKPTRIESPASSAVGASSQSSASDGQAAKEE